MEWKFCLQYFVWALGSTVPRCHNESPASSSFTVSVYNLCTSPPQHGQKRITHTTRTNNRMLNRHHGTVDLSQRFCNHRHVTLAASLIPFKER